MWTSIVKLLQNFEKISKLIDTQYFYGDQIWSQILMAICFRNEVLMGDQIRQDTPDCDYTYILIPDTLNT